MSEILAEFHGSVNIMSLQVTPSWYRRYNNSTHVVVEQAYYLETLQKTQNAGSEHLQYDKRILKKIYIMYFYGELKKYKSAFRKFTFRAKLIIRQVFTRNPSETPNALQQWQVLLTPGASTR
jgi:hypothetical protein